MITTVLFDLDGTLLPMDQDAFIRAYMQTMAQTLAPYGYDPQLLTRSVWAGTGAMVQNDGSAGNDQVFWQTFSAGMGRDCREDAPLFESYYRQQFQQVRHACGFAPEAAQVLALLKEKGTTAVLATNPLFPAVATHSRVRWAGLQPEDFALITTYENSRHCKPSLDYYRDILDTLDRDPRQCLMVGNDVGEDMIAAQLGMQVFLLTDCLIHKAGADLSQYPQGSFRELLAYLQNALE